MGRYTDDVEVPVEIDRAFDAWTDLGRLCQWQTATGLLIYLSIARVLLQL